MRILIQNQERKCTRQVAIPDRDLFCILGVRRFLLKSALFLERENPLSIRIEREAYIDLEREYEDLASPNLGFNGDTILFG
ncbi:hypothetical protein L2E82_40040 [Cichorium intybus]|uniref:Uncharacterized protein n=1 Tax=Cichorium intybus TaxID=13427 RepID=A0ACB9AK74_CICIN|nr:hypothetical protein L2E82_40040 [Cichorium intybus]